MPQTSNYLAGAESNNVELAYAVEAAWGALPAVQFRRIRYNSETLAGQKQRSRPNEINTTREASAALTVQETAGGNISAGLAYGVHDDLLGTLLGNDFGTALNISDATIALSAAGVLTATTANLFQNIVVGDWVRLGGFAASGGANNGLALVVAKASNLNITLARRAPFVLESAGTRTVRHNGLLVNGTQFQSLFFQKRFAANQFLRYPGGYATQATLGASLGQFLSLDMTLAFREELSATADASTGAVLAAPTGRVHDPIGGFGPLIVHTGAATLAPRATAASAQFANEGAAPQFELGSSAAAGMTSGTFTAGGSISCYFADFSLYDRFKSEAAGVFGFATADAAGNAYGVCYPAANVMNPRINAGGPGQPVAAQFDLEANPSATGTVRITRLNAP